MKFLLLLFLSTFGAIAQAADKQNATIFIYDEKEAGADIMHMRYIIGDDFMRIDEGQPGDDFILFDIHKNILYSINHDDMTIMFINYQPWTMPGDINRHIIDKQLPDAPKVAGKNIAQYHLLAKDKICAEVQYLPGVFADELNVLKRYQNVLSGQLVASLDNTPVEMQTDCMLVDQVYNPGDLYSKGLPIQEQHDNGFIKILVNFKQQDIASSLFELPEKYQRYQPFQAASQSQ